MAVRQDELFDALWERHRAGGAPSLGVVGGTFDPVHVGHTAMARAALDELALDGVLFVPAANPNFKQGKKIAPAEHRLHMVEHAIAGFSCVAASTIEIDRPGVTYTYDTLVELRRLLPPGLRLVFVMGADSLQTFGSWHRSAELVGLAHYAVAARGGSEVAPALDALHARGLDPVVHVLEARIPEVSSTQVRALLAAGGDAGDLLDPAVAAYAARHALYAPAPLSDTPCPPKGAPHGA